MKKLTVPHYELGTKLTEEQLELFEEHGAIIFRNFITPEKVAAIIAETQRVEREWLDAGLDKMNGIPLKFGRDVNGKKCIQRLCFLSQHSTLLKGLLADPRLQALTELVRPFEGRIGEDEKDGLVLNNYVRTEESAFSQMGWHTG
jgi:hypothetical protein